MSSNSHPRPILKRDSDISPIQLPTPTPWPPLPFSKCIDDDLQLLDLPSPHVHFPPTPGLTTTHPTHSPRTYDRAPIIVQPNSCQLPRRGARKLISPPIEYEKRGRSTKRRKSKLEESESKGSYFHPKAYEACEPEPLTGSSASNDPTTIGLPTLIPDSPLSDSSSSDSDSTIFTPPRDSSRIRVDGSSGGSYTSNSPLLKDVCSTEENWNRRPQIVNHHHSTSYNVSSRSSFSLGLTSSSSSGGGASSSFAPFLDEGCLGGF
ncbi:hypothetical protein C8Q75DRAFT_811177 [Abortiporus biennis]|nr:hypothetical protein C8Q75DRAFT_811177 [Abortiporus biennis]